MRRFEAAVSFPVFALGFGFFPAAVDLVAVFLVAVRTGGFLPAAGFFGFAVEAFFAAGFLRGAFVITGGSAGAEAAVGAPKASCHLA